MSKVYVLYGVNFIDEKRANVEPFIVEVSKDSQLIYQKACKIMLEELIKKHGKPQKIEKDDDLDDEKVFINQQIVRAYEVYKNNEKIPDGPNKGRIKLSWVDRYRRIDSIYEKLRPETKHHTMTGNYYYVTEKVLAQRARSQK